MRLGHLAAFLASAAVFAAAPAGAVPVRYTFTAVLHLVSGNDSILQVDGATLVIVADADTEAPLYGQGFGSNQISGVYLADSVTATFTNRPGGAPDTTISYLTTLDAGNRWAPNSYPDYFGLDLEYAWTPWDTLPIQMPSFYVELTSQEFYTGTGTPPLAAFAPSDVASITTTYLERYFDLAQYSLDQVTVTAGLLPAPAATALAGAALAFGWAALPRRHRV